MWGAYGLHGLGRVPGVGSVLYRSCTTSHDGRVGSRLSFCRLYIRRDLYVDDLSVDDLSVHDLFVDHLYVDDLYVDYISVEDPSVDDLSVRRVKVPKCA